MNDFSVLFRKRVSDILNFYIRVSTAVLTTTTATATATTPTGTDNDNNSPRVL